jgi:alcohol dehydrogenase (cytochrome c)
VKFKILALAIACGTCVFSQAISSEMLVDSSGKQWPTYNGDYSGRRYSPLAQINRDNVRSLSLAWAFQTRVAANLKCTPVMANGVLYFTVPDHVWAVDARTGEQIWHFHRPSDGNHIGQRGVALYKDRVFFGTPDAHLVSLDARNGKKIWDIQIADPAFGYYISMAPLVVKDRLIIGTSGDQADIPHSIQAIEPETGKTIWRWDSLPKPGQPGAETWPDKQSMSHGGGPAWITGTYDPELNLTYWGTGNPHPVLAGTVRKGDNLYTCTIVALNADTGALVWFFQPSPHDTHDWDAVETPVLFDAPFNGTPRKLLAQASRNGYFFVLDRVTGKCLVSSQFVPSNWASRVDAKGRPVPDPAREPQPDGTLVKSAAGGGTNWMAPSFDPETGLFYVSAMTGFSVWYLALNQNQKPEDHQGGRADSLWMESSLAAVDYRTGRICWTRNTGSGRTQAGVLSTAGGLVFTGDVYGNLLALDARSGEIHWHIAPGGELTSGPMTYELDGKQYLITAVDTVVYAWSLPER